MCCPFESIYVIEYYGGEDKFLAANKWCKNPECICEDEFDWVGCWQKMLVNIVKEDENDPN